MKILAVHDGHNASACYFRDGEIRYLLQEERFTGVKNQGGFPAKSLAWLEQQPDFTVADLDRISIGCFDLPVYDWRTSHDFAHLAFNELCRFVPNRLLGSQALVKPYLALSGIQRRRQLNAFAAAYRLPSPKIAQVEHHTAHGYAALYGSGFTAVDEPVLIITVDGSGDGLSATVAVWDKTNHYQRLQAVTSFNSLGYLFSRLTEYMGMKPGEHEYKLMGMAPYVPDKYSAAVFNRLREAYFDLDESGLGFCHKTSRGTALLEKMKQDFFLTRFDNVCAGAQRHFEYVLFNFVNNWARKTKIKTAVFGGGCMMNVKANLLIQSGGMFDRCFFMPSSGDESTAVGAAYYWQEKAGGRPGAPLGSLYKGTQFSNDDVLAALRPYADQLEFQHDDDIEGKTAELLANFAIVGRFKGAAEWGARALGNRSIICRGDDLRIIHKLNKAIKMRDFWMPFAASILEEDADRYLVNPQHLEAPYMTLAFATTPLAHQELAAAIHPFDKSCRPQLVKQAWNPDYHRLICLLRDRTGLSGVLNTSFNLHGKPIVGTPQDAIETLLGSERDALALENYLVRVKGRTVG